MHIEQFESETDVLPRMNLRLIGHLQTHHAAKPLQGIRQQIEWPARDRH
jgi:hypothetical protein